MPPRPVGTRAQIVHRLQIGVLGLLGILLMVALANIVMERAKESDARTVPQAAPTVEPTAAASPKSDPLADAGVVPEMPTEPAVGAQPPVSRNAEPVSPAP